MEKEKYSHKSHILTIAIATLVLFVLFTTILPAKVHAYEQAIYSIADGNITVSINVDGSYNVTQNSEEHVYVAGTPIVFTGSGAGTITLKAIGEINTTAVPVTFSSMLISGDVRISKAKVDITLVGNNGIAVGSTAISYLYICNSSIVTIDGDGSLTCKGYGGAWDDAAGITVSNHNNGDTKLYINGGTINATGGGGYSAGIGAKWYEECGTIIINGGTVVATSGGQFAAGIGGTDWYSKKVNIEINGGTVTAIGGTYAAGIGAGIQTQQVHVKITGGTVISTAGASKRNAGSRYPYAIGCGAESGSLANSQITIDGGAIFTTSNMLLDCCCAKDSNGNNLGQVTFYGLSAEQSVTALTVNGSSYGVTNATVNQSGQFIAWLPIGENSIVSLVVGTNQYTYNGKISSGMKINCILGSVKGYSSDISSKVEVITGEYGGDYTDWYSEITFNSNGGAGSISPLTVAENDTTTQLPANTFTRDGYTYSNWNTKADGSGTAYIDQTDNLGAIGNTTLYAQWTADVYAVTFNANSGGGNMNGSTATYDTPFIMPECNFTPPDGMQFKAWAIGSTGGTQVASGETYSITADTTVYALWELSVKTTPSSFVNGNAPESLKITLGEGLASIGATDFDYLTIDDGARMDSSSPNFTVENGSIVITFAKSYLNTFTEGVHNVDITLTGTYAGTYRTTVTVVAPESYSPTTGDSNIVFLWLGWMIFAALGIVISAIHKKQREN